MNVNDGTVPCPTCLSGMHRSAVAEAKRAERAEAALEEICRLVYDPSIGCQQTCLRVMQIASPSPSVCTPKDLREQPERAGPEASATPSTQGADRKPDSGQRDGGERPAPTCNTCGAVREYIGKRRWRCPTVECKGIVDWIADPPRPSDAPAWCKGRCGRRSHPNNDAWCGAPACNLRPNEPTRMCKMSPEVPCGCIPHELGHWCAHSIARHREASPTNEEQSEQWISGFTQETFIEALDAALREPEKAPKVIAWIEKRRSETARYPTYEELGRWRRYVDFVTRLASRDDEIGKSAADVVMALETGGNEHG